MEPVASSEGITVLLRQWGNGDEHALDDLVPLVYGHLRDLAGRFLRSERPDHMLQPTELVNEAYLRLLKQNKNPWQNRAHFFAVASRVMRNILVDYARQHQRKKRGGGFTPVSLESVPVASPVQSANVLALDEVLSRLASKDPRQSRIVEMHCFGGVGLADVAQVLGISERTVHRDWKFAKAWLHRELHRQDQDSARLEAD